MSLVAGALLSASAYAMMNGQIYSGMHTSNTVGTNGYYGNMMSNYGTTGQNMMGGTGGGMMGGYGYNSQITASDTDSGCGNSAANSTAISINTAVTDAQNYLTSLNNPDLAVTQVEEYSNNFYVQINEKSTGNGASELIVDKYSGSIYPEMGPNMMWNTKYEASTAGMMGAGGMMSGYGYNTITPTTTLPITETQAKANAQQYLNTNYQGTTTGDITMFYGYYTGEVINGTITQGMLSVNGYSGQVWYHTWHGAFIQEIDVS